MATDLAERLGDTTSSDDTPPSDFWSLGHIACRELIDLIDEVCSEYLRYLHSVVLYEQETRDKGWG